MHYYKRNIGDYHKKAGRLTMLQHGAYTLLMDAIYDREKFPTLEMAIDWVWASNQEEINAITFVCLNSSPLKMMFILQNRMRQEIQEYTGVCQSNSINGKKGGRPKGSKNKPKKTQSVNLKTQSVNLKSELNRRESESKPNHKPLTTNQEPLTNNHKPDKDISPSAQSATPPVKWNKKHFANELIKLGANEQHANDWMKSRKAFTETAFNGTINQINKSGKSVYEVVAICAENGWKGFKAEYVEGRHSIPKAESMSFDEMMGFANQPNNSDCIDGELVNIQPKEIDRD